MSSIESASPANCLQLANFSDTGVAMDGDDYIVYDKASGSLSYDSDGSGAALAIMFAQLGANTQLVGRLQRSLNCSATVR